MNSLFARPLRALSHALLAIRLTWVVALLLAFALPVSAHAAPPTTGMAAAGLAAATPGTTESAPPSALDEHAPRVREGDVPALPELGHDYVRMEIGGFLTLRFVRGAEVRVEPIVRGAEELKARLTEALGTPVLPHVEVRIAHNFDEMALIGPIGYPPPRYASGVSYRGMHLILISLQAPKTFEAVNVDETFRHELTHQALDDATAGRHVPAWLHEGLAVYMSGESSLARQQSLSDAVFSKSIFPLAELDAHMPHEDADYKVSVAYAQSADFVRYLMRKGDSARFVGLITRVRAGTEFSRALTDAYGADPRTLEYQWKESLNDRFPFWAAVGTGASLWGFGILALGYGYIKRRNSRKLTLARWEKEQTRLATARIRALEEQARIAAITPPDPGPILPVPVPHVHHEGEWYTLH